MKKQLYVGKAGFISTNPKTVESVITTTINNNIVRRWEPCDAIPTIIEAIPSQQRIDECRADYFEYWTVITESPIISQVGITISTNDIKTLEILWELGIRWDNDNSF